MSNFKLGDKVEWRTTAKHIRTGIVVFIVPIGESPSLNTRSFSGFRFINSVGGLLEKFITDNIFSGKYLSKISDGYSRHHESYLIDSPNEKGKPSLYWPRVSALKKLRS